MKFKLDENFGPSALAIFVRDGHDCRTVREENLGGATDRTVLDAAVSEGRILVTMDRDFASVLVYPPAATHGIAVISPPGRSSRPVLHALVETLLLALQTRSIRGKLWIVEIGRIREHEPEDPSGLEVHEPVLRGTSR